MQQLYYTTPAIHLTIWHTWSNRACRPNRHSVRPGEPHTHTRTHTEAHPLKEHLLACMHVRDNDLLDSWAVSLHLCRMRKAVTSEIAKSCTALMLYTCEEAWDNGSQFSPRLYHGVSQLAHAAIPTASIHNLHTLRGQTAAQLCRGTHCSTPLSRHLNNEQDTFGF